MPAVNHGRMIRITIYTHTLLELEHVLVLILSTDLTVWAA